MFPSFHIKLLALFFVVAILATTSQRTYAQTGVNDTIVSFAVIYNGDTIEAKTLQTLPLYSRLTEKQRSDLAKWTRLRNAVYVTYPYARRAGAVMNDINTHLVNESNKATRKAYIQTREKELKKEFTDPLTNLSVYQGKVLMKLIYRETGNNCYNLIHEYKGGFTAGFWQTIAILFGSNLKQNYDPTDKDRAIEIIVQDVERMYGQRS